jgi:hypothetical protein
LPAAAGFAARGLCPVDAGTVQFSTLSAHWVAANLLLSLAGVEASALAGGKQLLGAKLGRPGLDALQPLGVVAELLFGRSAILDRADDVDVQAKAGGHCLARRTQAATST